MASYREGQFFREAMPHPFRKRREIDGAPPAIVPDELLAKRVGRPPLSKTARGRELNSFLETHPSENEGWGNKQRPQSGLGPLAACGESMRCFNGLRGVIQPFAARGSEVGQRRPRIVAQTASEAAPADVEALSTVCLRR